MAEDGKPSRPSLSIKSLLLTVVVVIVAPILIAAMIYKLTPLLLAGSAVVVKEVVAQQPIANTTWLSPLPQGYSNVSVVYLNNNWAVLPEDWNNTSIGT